MIKPRRLTGQNGNAQHSVSKMSISSLLHTIPRPVIDDSDPYPSRTAKVPEEKRETRIEEIHRLLERDEKKISSIPKIISGIIQIEL